MLGRLLPLLLALGGCGERQVYDDALIHQDGAVIKKDASRDKGQQDRGRMDRLLRPDAAGPLSFCKGPPMAEVDGSKFAVSGFKTGLQWVASCCPPGEVITFNLIDSRGKPAEISLEIARFPGTTLKPTQKLDLAHPPKGWLFMVRCSSNLSCGPISDSTSQLSGTLELNSLLGSPALEATICLSAKPKAPSSPYTRPVKLWTSKVVVNTACVPGMDQTCNYDPKISSLRGKCNPDSTCTCNPGAQKQPNGKCK